MSIRKRLITFFVLIIALLVSTGAILKLGAPIVIKTFRQSLDSMNLLNEIREFRSNIITQKTSISRYLLLDDPQEYLKFDEASGAAQKSILSLQNKIGPSSPEWFVELKKSFDLVSKSSRRVAEDYKRGWKAKAHEEWLSELSSQMQKLVEQVNSIEKKQSEEASQKFETIRRLIDSVGEIIVVVFILVFLIGLFLFISLYNGVMGPLQILEKGTKEFGKGQWDHRIALSTKNEFGALAHSFNNMAESVKQLQIQAVHLDRMSAVGQLAGGVAHEINNPLTAVLGQAQILLAKTPETDPTHASLKKIENAAIRCRKIVRGLLDFSRPSQSTFEPIEVNEILNSTMDLCEADLKKGRVNIERKLANNLPKTLGNSSELQQVLLNLINNAIQAMPKGGTLTLETHTHKRKLVLTERRKGVSPKSSEGPWVEIIIKDTGVGIPSEHLNKIFEPFFTTKEIGQGTGLGLAVSVGIVQKHNGDLRVESEGVNRGATFILSLPVKTERSSIRG